MMTQIKMKVMEKFPIEKLSYDQKLELLENMEPGDVVELVNVNQGFRSIVVREPWRIFGKHVDHIVIRNSDRPVPTIRKSRDWIDTDHDEPSIQLSESYRYRWMERKTYLNLISRIRSCQKLEWKICSKDDEPEDQLALVELLTNLCSVGELDIWFENRPNSGKYLTSLTPNHIKKACLGIGCTAINKQLLGTLSNFVETRLNHCKSIEIRHISSNYFFWYEPLSKIWTEMIFLLFPSHDYENLVDRIVTKGIPSSNPEAAILLDRSCGARPANNSITYLLSLTPEVNEIALEDRGEIGELLKTLFDEHDLLRFALDELLRKGAYFSRSINTNRKCIYVTEPCDRFFFAKYITI